jgi:hypothetical protein
LAQFLKCEIKYPYFSKPAHGSFGRGAAAVREYDSDRDELVLMSNERIPVHEYIEQCHPREGVYPWQSGFIFQEYIEPHPAIESICGRRLTSIRMIVLLTDTGPRLVRAVWKVLTGTNMVDNFEHGEKGNLLGLVDVRSGMVKRVLSGVGLDQREVDSNPDTGVQFQGFIIPEWDVFVETAQRAATVFPALRMQHWDIAVSSRGPVVLEVNIGGDLDLPQLVDGKGFLNDKFSHFLTELGNKYAAYR